MIDRPEVNGVFHVGGADRVSRHEFGRMAAQRAGVPDALIEEVSMYDVTAAAPRGADCSLVCEKVRRTLGIEPLSCGTGLDILARQGYLRLSMAD